MYFIVNPRLSDNLERTGVFYYCNKPTEAMMKKALSLVMVFVAGFMWSSTGISAQKYVSGNIGINWFNDAETSDAGTDLDKIKLNSGLTLTGAFGCDYGAYRVEGELGYQSSEVDSIVDLAENTTDEDVSADVAIVSLMMNGYYDIELSGIEISPYAGVGAAQVSFDDWNDGTADTNETTLAWQLGAVFGFPVADNIMLDARYRYFKTTDFNLDLSGDETDLETHSALLGMRINID